MRHCKHSELSVPKQHEIFCRRCEIRQPADRENGGNQRRIDPRLLDEYPAGQIGAPDRRGHHRYAERHDHRAAVVEQSPLRSEEHTSELQSLMRISYAVFCLKKKTQNNTIEQAKRNYNKKATDTTRTTCKYT